MREDWERPEIDRQERPAPAVTVRARIEDLLNTPGPTRALGGFWWSLADVQQRIRGSSVRSRLQDIMADDRARPEAERLYDQKDTISEVGKARYNIYRRRAAGVQPTLFDVKPQNPLGA